MRWDEAWQSHSTSRQFLTFSIYSLKKSDIHFKNKLILLDTHLYLWCINDDPALSPKAKALILEANEVYVSSVSIWEACIKIKLGKLDADMDSLISAITHSGFIELSLTAQHAGRTYQLPLLHRDPFDRILIAQALTEPLKFLTSDSKLKSYSDLVEIV
jgi:PIN domain nuclease of toxin-antitoxin system